MKLFEYKYTVVVILVALFVIIFLSQPAWVDIGAGIFFNTRSTVSLNAVGETRTELV